MDRPEKSQTPRPQSLREVLLGNRNLQYLQARVEYLQKTDLLLRSHLDSSLREHCRIANIRDNILVIFVESSAWAARFRFCIPTLLEKLKSEPELQGLKSVQVRVNPLLGGYSL